MPPSAAIRFGADEWPRSRFVRSALFETTQAVRTLMRPGKQLHQRSWLDQVDIAGARARLPVLRALNPAAGWVPDFLVPPPRSRERGIDEELAEVAACPPAVVAAEIRRSLDSRPGAARQAVLEPLIADPAAALETIVAELRWAWLTLLAPFWPAVHELIDADIGHRSAVAARDGLGATLGDLNDRVSWAQGSVVVRRPAGPVTLDPGGQGLALMPSAYVWPDVLVAEGPWPPTLIYPARGIGELWAAPPAPSAGLAGVLGATRALLLADLDRPATTTALAGRHGLKPASISAQLSRLRAAGLVTSRREGKEVHYRRTPLADALVSA